MLPFVLVGGWLFLSRMVSVLQLDNKISMQQKCTRDANDGDDRNPVNDGVGWSYTDS